MSSMIVALRNPVSVTHTRNDDYQANGTTRQPKTFPNPCNNMLKHKQTSININKQQFSLKNGWFFSLENKRINSFIFHLTSD